MRYSTITLLIRLVLIAALASGTHAAFTIFTPSAAAIAGDDDDEGEGGDDDDEDDDDGDDDDGNKDKDDNENGDDKNNGKNGRGKKGERIDVQAIALYMVDADCEVDDSETTCQLTPRNPEGARDVTHLVIPADAVCAEVVDGDARLLDPDPVTGETGYTTPGGEREMTLVFEGEVSLGAQTTYWVKVAGAVVPATGPTFECPEALAQAPLTPTVVATTEPQSTTPALPTLPSFSLTPGSPTSEATTELTDSTGSIVVELFDCPIASEEADYDWFGQCDPVSEESRFRLVADGAETAPSTQAVTDEGGHARFSQLDPGVYVLTQMDRDWCHATSDGVDDQGNVIVRAGERTTVWVFACTALARNRAPAV